MNKIGFTQTRLQLFKKDPRQRIKRLEKNLFVGDAICAMAKGINS
jgi:hypothetical protein